VLGALDLSVPNEAAQPHAWGWTMSVVRAMELSLARPVPGGRAEAELAVTDLDEPFNAVRGVLDLLASRLDVSGTTSRSLTTPARRVDEAELRLASTLHRLNETEQQLGRIADSGMVGLLYWRMDGSITWANDRFLEIVGYTRADLDAGRLDWKALTPPEWAHTDDRAIEEVLATGRTTPWQKEYVRRDGSRVAVLLTAATFAGSREQGLTLVHDITDRVEAQRRMEDALERRAAPSVTGRACSPSSAMTCATR
jgi:PAS domain S-box-containing protein